MKKILCLALALVLTAALFTGCGCTNRNRPAATTPTGMTEMMPTSLPTTVPTIPATQATVPTTRETIPPMTTEEPVTGTTGSTDATVENRSNIGTVR